MEGAGILLIAIAIALMLIPPIHVTIVQPHALSATIGTLVRAQYGQPPSSLNLDDVGRHSASAIAERSEAADPRAPDKR